MPQFSANVSTLFRELPLSERIVAAAAAGFDAIEIQFPYDQDPLALREALDASRIPLVLMNFPVDDLMTGGEGLAAVPGRETEFGRALDTARQFAEILQPRAMNLLAGRPRAQHHPDKCLQVFKNNLRQAYRMTSELGITLLTEPVNTIDMPGFFLHGSRQALELIASLTDVELSIQYDFYHMHMAGEDLPRSLTDSIEHTGHIQFSNAPGRTEPGLGTIDFAPLFTLIDRLGYAGYVGAEYFPSRATEDTLDWLPSRPE